MVQTLNLILRASRFEVYSVEKLLGTSPATRKTSSKTLIKTKKECRRRKSSGICDSFSMLVNNPVATFSLCLLAQAYDLSFALVKRFSQMEDVSVGFLMQIDKLVYLLESPIFVHLRLKLLDVESPSHAPLLKSIYGILLCLPQGDAFRLLNNRLTTVCNLRENLGLAMPDMAIEDGASTGSHSANGNVTLGRSLEALLTRYDEVLELHRVAQEQYNNFVHDEQQRLQIHVTSGSHQIMASSSGRSGGYANGLSPQRQNQQYVDRRLWD
eukprot:CAMPEP_0178771686 /NCGR_PEP_ID=MMETSP0744-20121128/22091_1 /TAXON_ID=913974 /ORGANISM="Nitzschia punctata, Strain CCMP561" /LENGTH=268 /DNA_ID=CAMNT_0020428213 /DNA_START=130 /DNA_END=937 /DNA_ORIENTATION=-